MTVGKRDEQYSTARGEFVLAESKTPLVGQLHLIQRTGLARRTQCGAAALLIGKDVPSSANVVSDATAKKNSTCTTKIEIVGTHLLRTSRLSAVFVIVKSALRIALRRSNAELLKGITGSARHDCSYVA